MRLLPASVTHPERCARLHCVQTAELAWILRQLDRGKEVDEVAVIVLTRLNGQAVAINPDLMTWIDVTPDTTVSLLGGDRIIVLEALDEVIDRIIQFRRAVGATGAPRYDAALGRLARRNSDPPPPAAPTHAPQVRR